MLECVDVVAVVGVVVGRVGVVLWLVVGIVVDGMTVDVIVHTV